MSEVCGTIYVEPNDERETMNINTDTISMPMYSAIIGACKGDDTNGRTSSAASLTAMLDNRDMTLQDLNEFALAVIDWS